MTEVKSKSQMKRVGMQVELKNIFVLACNLKKYHFAVLEFIPGLERYHKIKFSRKNNDYVSEKFTIRPALLAIQTAGFTDYQLIKYSDFWENPEAAKIEQQYQMDLLRRKK